MDRALNKSQQFKDLHLKAQAAQSEVRQVENQALELECELSQFQRMVETPAEERDNETQRLKDSLLPKPFGITDCLPLRLQGSDKRADLISIAAVAK